MESRGFSTFIFAFLLRFLLGFFLLLRSRSRSRGGSSVSLGVVNAILELLDLAPTVFSLDGNRQGLLVTVDNGVHDGWQGWEVGRQGDAADVANGGLQASQELLLPDVKNTRAEKLTVIVDLGHVHTVGERRDVQHVEEGGLGSADLESSLDELKFGGDFNGTTRNLGGDAQSLEEGCLIGRHAGVASGNEDIERREGTSTSRGSDSVGKDRGPNFLQVLVGEDKADVA